MCGCQTGKRNQDNCGCCNSGCGCGESSHCGHSDHEHEKCCWSDKLLELADVAWEEVFIEKVKDHIRSNDKKIGEAAVVVAEANKERWRHKMAERSWKEEYTNRLKGCMCGSCCGNGDKAKK